MMIDTDSQEFEDAVMRVVRSRLGLKVRVNPETYQSHPEVEVTLKDTGIPMSYYNTEVQYFTSDSDSLKG